MLEYFKVVKALRSENPAEGYLLKEATSFQKMNDLTHKRELGILYANFIRKADHCKKLRSYIFK